MGYKLAGFDVIGCNEIDPRMMSIYCKNHNPKFPFLEPIQTFKDRQDLPPELFNLDILDGSPPCSTFSMAGSREDAWGKLKHFREGQAEQVLDTLFFDFIDLAKKLQPKVVVAENVKGLVLGNAKDYVRRIYQGFEDAGYYVKHFLLDAQQMGVPQRRERVFFLCLRKDITSPVLVQDGFFDMTPRIEMEFNEKPILFRELFNDHFQNFKVYGIPKAQLIIADPPYNLGVNAYASNPSWYVGGDNKNGESDKAGKEFFDTDKDFRHKAWQRKRICPDFS